MASAQFYWGRMAALLLRLIYHLTPVDGWHLVYVDDYISLLREVGAPHIVTLILLVLTATGTPLSWKKCHLDTTNSWLGFLISLTTHQVHLGPHRLPLVDDIVTDIIADRPQPTNTIERWAGLLNWASTAHAFLRPALQHVYAWLEVTRASSTPTRPPHRLWLVAHMVQNVIRRPPPPHDSTNETAPILPAGSYPMPRMRLHLRHVISRGQAYTKQE